MTTNIELGKRINSVRTARGLTLDDVAVKIGVAKSTVSRYENGTIARVKLPVVESIAKVLDVDPNWLLGNVDDPSPLLPVVSSLTDEERRLISNYRLCSEQVREAAYVMLEHAACYQ